MSRTQTSNYLAATETSFYWAGDSNDYFSRELDLASLARALEQHTHTTGKGLPVQGYAAGSIPTSAIVPNPIFPGTVSIASGGISVIGVSAFTGNVGITGNLAVSGTITGNGALSTTSGGLTVAGQINTSTGGMAITGNSTITGSLSVSSTLGCGNASTGSITASGSITTTGALGASTGLTVNAGGMVIVGNSTINSGFLHVSNGAIVAGGNISNTTGGADFVGTVNAHNDMTVFGNLGVFGNTGFTGTLQPASNGGANLGVGGGVLEWATLFAQHFAISGTCSAAGLLTLTAGLTVSAGTTNLANTTINGNIGVLGNSGFTGTITPASDGGADCGALGVRWNKVYAVTGTIQTSSIDVKEHLEELSPSLALQVALDTKLYEFQYKTPDGEGAYKNRKTKKARRDRQAGFIAEDAHPLLLVEEGGVNGQNTASVALAAIQALYAKVEALTAELAELKGTLH